ncbi:MAG: hypothetical protein IV090_05975 [Candidatus Sericytochromatia bacterium]|nr:hypothetical protein [Candidatus Sericytochromatia bacterium]
MIERLNSATLRAFSLFNDLFLFSLLFSLLPLPMERLHRIALGLGLLLLLEVFVGKTPGSLLAGYRMQLDSRSWLLKGLWLGICFLRYLLCIELLYGVVLGVCYSMQTFLANLLNLVVFLALLIFCIICAFLLSCMLFESLENMLNIQRKQFDYAEHEGLFRSCLPLIGYISLFFLTPRSLEEPLPLLGPDPYTHVPMKVSVVKSHMATLEAMLQIYASDWNGVYPESLKTLEQEAKQNKNPYWKDMVNPWTGKSGSQNTLANHKDLLQSGIEQQGYVSFEVPATSKYRRYFIYGYDKHGKKIKDKGQVFVLSNARD